MEGSDTYQFPKLKGSENYESWRIDAISALKSKGLWWFTSGKLEKSEIPNPCWNTRSYGVYWYFGCCCSEAIYEVEGENSTGGPQPYQPYEAEVTNSPISNTPLWESEPPNSPCSYTEQYYTKLIRLLEACPRVPDGYTFIYRLVPARGHPRLAMLFYTICPRPRPSTVPRWLCFYIPFALARGPSTVSIWIHRYPRFEGIHSRLNLIHPGWPRFCVVSVSFLAS